MDIQNALASRVTSLKASAIREIFKMLGQADVISFAGGIPSPELFPANEWGELLKDMMESKGKSALVYGVTEGYAPLIEEVTKRLKRDGVPHDFDQVVITTGAQQAIDLTCKSLVNEGEGIIVEEPSFIGSLNSFRSYNAKLFGVEMASDGIDTDKVEEILKKEKIKLIYTIPTFQNPTGVTQSLEKRKKLLELAEKYDCYIIEDNPYGELRFTGEAVPAIKSMDDNGRVIYVGSFSKTLSPGIRVGFVCCHRDIMDRIIVVKQVNDVHTTLMMQMLVYDYITKYDFDKHIEKSCALHGEKCAVMLSSIEKYFPKCVDYTRPEGGIFLWCTLPEGVDAKPIFEKAVARKVAFVPGSTCMVDLEAPCNAFRLNYSTASNEDIEKGIKILGDLLKEELE